MSDPKKRGAGIYIVNNTGTDISMFHDALVDAILDGGRLSDDLSDILTIAPVTVGGGIRWIVEFSSDGGAQ